MPKLEWNRPEDQTFEAGLDRGVIYVEDGPAVAWNGLTNIDDDGSSNVKEFYVDGIKFLATVSPRDWKGKLTAYTYPNEFGGLIGIAELGDGLYVDSQAPGRFGLSYRTMVTTPAVDKKQHYKIHLIYKVMASLDGFANETWTGSTDPTEFEFELSAVPIKIPGHRPSAHIILDTRKLDEVTIASLEDIIYGTDTQEAAMPTIEQLIDLMAFGDRVVVVDNGDGTWTATGSNLNVRLLDNQGHFQIDNVAAEYLTPEIYEFFGIDVITGFFIALDEDTIPFYEYGEGLPNLNIDTDGNPFYEVESAEALISEDEDGIPYFITSD